jgi:hypothetical protein
MENENASFCRKTCHDISKLFYCHLSHIFLLFFLHAATAIMAETLEIISNDNQR